MNLIDPLAAVLHLTAQRHMSGTMSHASMKKWKAEHPEEARAHARAGSARWRAKNPERVKELSRKYRSTPEFKAKRRAHRAQTHVKAKEAPAKKAGFERLAARLPWTYWLLRTARNTAKAFGMEFSLTTEDLERMWSGQGGLCKWTKIQMVQARKSGHLKASLDRLNGDGGYTPDNVVLTTWFANRARGTMSVEEFLETMKVAARAFS